MKPIIYNTVHQLMSNFLYYDRKEDEDLEVGAVEKAIIADPSILEGIVEIVVRSLESSVASYKK